MFFPKTPPELGSRLDFGVQGLARVPPPEITHRGLLLLLFAWFLHYGYIWVYLVAHDEALI
jgi:hypothetical protein